MKVKLYTIVSILVLGMALTLAWLLIDTLSPFAQAAPDSLASSVIYVDVNASDPVDGLTWSTAYTNVQDALTSAGPGDEIWVAEGVYIPTYQTDAGNIRSATFVLTNNVALYGGFVATETLRTQRDWEAHVTVLSGDLDRDDVTDAHGVVTNTVNITGTNVYHVITSNGVTETTVLDGFIITAGNADGPGINDQGGGMFNSYGSPRLANVTFSGNSAAFGGGLNNIDSTSQITNVTFSGNSAIIFGGGMLNVSSSPQLANITFNGNSAEYGGGIFNEASNPKLGNITFSGNHAKGGGGMYNRHDSPQLANVTFSGNSASGSGGGMYNDRSSPTLTNVTFSGNYASLNGGGIGNYSSNPQLTNVTFSSNSASSNGGGMHNDRSSPTLTNSILWNNSDYGGMDQSAQIHIGYNSPITIAYSLVQGEIYTGTSNISASPLFVRKPNPGDGDWTTLADNDYGDLKLRHNSPAIDAGENAALPADTTDLDSDGNTTEPIPLDLAGIARIMGNTVDMGAYEWRPIFYLPLVLQR